MKRAYANRRSRGRRGSVVRYVVVNGDVTDGAGAGGELYGTVDKVRVDVAGDME